MNTSFSALDTFRICPLKYKYQEIDRIKTPKSADAVFGTLIHSTMKFIYDGNFTLPTQKQALDFFSKNWNVGIFKNEIDERVAFAQGIKIIQNYYQKNNPQEAQIVDLESRFTIDVKDKDETHLISGFIDRIDKTENGFEIIDYKTSRKMPAQSIVDDNLQLLIYLLAFLKRYPAVKPENIKLSLYFLKHGAKLSTQKREDQIEEEKMKIIDTINEVKNSKFEPRVSPLCGWCGYQKTCPMWKHKFKQNQESRIKSQEDKNKIIQEYIELQENIKNSRKKIAELSQQILEIMKEEEAERLFSDNKIISRTSRKTWKYDEDKLKNVLEAVGMWENILKIDGVKLKKVAETLSPKIKNQIENSKHISKESFGLSVRQSK